MWLCFSNCLTVLFRHHAVINVGETVAIAGQAAYATEGTFDYHLLNSIDSKETTEGQLTHMYRALDVAPSQYYMHVLVGQNYRTLGKPEAALYHLKQAVQSNPLCAYANQQIAQVYDEQGDGDRAMQTLYEAVLQAEDDLDMYMIMADMLYRYDAHETAKWYYNRVDELFNASIAEAQELGGDAYSMSESDKYTAMQIKRARCKRYNEQCDDSILQQSDETQSTTETATEAEMSAKRTVEIATESSTSGGMPYIPQIQMPKLRMPTYFHSEL